MCSCLKKLNPTLGVCFPFRYAAFAVSNLAANANHRQQIVDEGGPEALVALACCEDLNAQRQALSALRGICISPQFRELVVRQVWVWMDGWMRVV